MTRPVPVCPHCVPDEERPLVCRRCGWRWYANPVPAAGVLLERAGANGEPAILLLRRAVEPGAGRWDLPAGYLDHGESFEDAARRECREEAGLDVVLVELRGVYHSPAANAVTAVFLARETPSASEVSLDFESSDHAWVGRADVEAWLPRIAFPSMAAAVRDWAEAADR